MSQSILRLRASVTIIDMEIDKLPDSFVGTGEVKHFLFTKLAESITAYLFKVQFEESEHYEVMKRLVTPICLDFEKKIYSETHFKEYYPKSNSFGTNAWSFYTQEEALGKFYEI